MAVKDSLRLPAAASSSHAARLAASDSALASRLAPQHHPATGQAPLASSEVAPRNATALRMMKEDFPAVRIGLVSSQNRPWLSGRVRLFLGSHRAPYFTQEPAQAAITKVTPSGLSSGE